MDLIALSILSISMLGIAVLATVNGIKKHSPSLKETTVYQDISSTIKKGYAYTVDIGDSLLIVAVIDKNGSNEITFIDKDLSKVEDVINDN